MDQNSISRYKNKEREADYASLIILDYFPERITRI